MKKQKVRINPNPHFKVPKSKVKIDTSYFKKRMREIRRTLPKTGV